MASLTIDTDFSAGSIEIERLPTKGDVELLLRDDTAADIRQWFSFTDRLDTYCHEFLDQAFYDPDPPGMADLSCASNQIGERYGVAAITLELPMKDTGTEAVRPGWSERRAMRFGASMVDALAETLDDE